MTNEPAPLVPTMPYEAFRITFQSSEQCARACWSEAQAQARRADEAEARESFLQRVMDESRHKLTTEVYAERDALQARVVELLAELKLAQEREGGPYKVCDKGHIFNSLLGGECPYCERRDLRATLAQRDREVLALREALEPWGPGGIITGTVLAWISPKDMAVAKAIVRGKVVVDNALAATAQAGAEAERRIREDERGKMTVASRDVLAERLRQIEAEGWTPEHDDHHPGGVMASAAACYAAASRQVLRDGTDPEAICAPGMWPWDRHWWKPAPVRRMLVKAGALILAEIERLDRAAILGTGGEDVDLSKCPKCGGPADNGHDRCLPPNPYFCTKCESGGGAMSKPYATELRLNHRA